MNMRRDFVVWICIIRVRAPAPRGPRLKPAPTCVQHLLQGLRFVDMVVDALNVGLGYIIDLVLTF